MTARRPLVRKDGKIQQLPDGDTVMGVPMYVLALKRSGVLLKLALTVRNTLPVTKRNGAVLGVAVAVNG